MIDISQEEFGTLAICAVRYCQGRMSYMPTAVRAIVKSFIQNITDRDLRVMINDCQYQEELNLYGDERIDKPGWLEWRDFLLEEQRRRTAEKRR
jgi:hypothetical protein